MPLHAALRTSTRPALLLAAACLMLPAGLAGCYRYNTQVRNASAQDVQISILKGTRHREIGSAVLAPGGSVGWKGATNGPVLARVTAEGVVHDVELPRRALTEIDVWGGDLTVTVAGTEQQVTQEDDAADSDAAADTDADDIAEDADTAEDESLDLIESDD